MNGPVGREMQVVKLSFSLHLVDMNARKRRKQLDAWQMACGATYGPGLSPLLSCRMSWSKEVEDKEAIRASKCTSWLGMRAASFLCQFGVQITQY